jgi:hypothetical protein
MTDLGDRLTWLGASVVLARKTAEPWSPTGASAVHRQCETVDRREFPGRRHTAFWDDDRLLKVPLPRPWQSLLRDRDAAAAIVPAGGESG